LLDCSLAANTKSAYESALRDFDKFRCHMSLSKDWPVALGHIAQYIANLSLLGRSPSTVAVHMSAISREHKILGMSDPTNHFLIQKLMYGLRRSVKRCDTRAPITVEILQQLPKALDAICFSNYEAELFKAAFSLAFFGFLRVGEMVFTTMANMDRPLKVDDVSVHSEFMEVTIRLSKTDQNGHGITLRLPQIQQVGICPVQAMRRYLRVRSKRGVYLFQHFDGKWVTRSQFTKVLTKALRFLHLNTAQFKAHSFRIGAATAAAIQGVSKDNIQGWGRWSSNAYQRYIRIAWVM